MGDTLEWVVVVWVLSSSGCFCCSSGFDRLVCVVEFKFEFVLRLSSRCLKVGIRSVKGTWQGKGRIPVFIEIGEWWIGRTVSNFPYEFHLGSRFA